MVRKEYAGVSAPDYNLIQMAIEHFYKSIPGHFTFEEFYSFVAERADNRCRQDGKFRVFHAVEVGVLNGQSAAYLLVELVNHLGATNVKLDLVDNFGWNPALAEEVHCRLLPGGYTNVVLGDSAESAGLYPEVSLDFVFLDADHAYESVSLDIDSWLPKIRRGGILAGHDFNWQFPGVVQAVVERFSKFHVWRGSEFEGKDCNYFPAWWVEV